MPTQEKAYTGDELMGEVFDLMRRGLPRLREDDPVRPCLMSLLPAMARALGRSPLYLIDPLETQET